MIGSGVDSDDPKKILLRQGAVYLYAVDRRSVFLILRNNAGHNGVDLRSLEMLKAHISPANRHGLLRHLHDSFGIRGIVPEENIGDRCKNRHWQHNEHSKNGEQSL